MGVPFLAFGCQWGDFMHYYTDAMRNFAVFSGRASRSQYWFFSLAFFIMFVVAMVIDQTLGDTTRNEPAGLFTAIVYLAHLLPAISVPVRRLHDTDRSGWWVFAGFVPLIGQIALLVFYASRQHRAQTALAVVLLTMLVRNLAQTYAAWRKRMRLLLHHSISLKKSPHFVLQGLLMRMSSNRSRRM